MTAEDGAAKGIAIPWDRLKTWIANQEETEQQTGKPAPLTQTQIAAIASLISLFNEPDVSGQDYVSLLCQKLQAYRLPLPTFENRDPFQGAAHQLRWRCICRLKSIEGSFPREGFGITVGEPEPSFQSKKAAKQFAAQQALEFLQSGNTALNIFPTPSPYSTPTRSNRFFTPSDTTPTTPPALGSSLKRPHDSPQQRARAAPASSPLSRDEAASTIFEQVSSSAALLGYDNPTYQVFEEEDRPGFFHGHPEFLNRGPKDAMVGHVKCIYGKKSTRLRIAERVLEWFHEEKARREQLRTGA